MPALTLGGTEIGLLLLSLCLAVAPPRVAAEGPPPFSPAAAATFQTRCMACHTYGNGIKVGPDLKGVTSRRQRAWLVRFIRSSSKVIASGDPVATELYERFKHQRMPDWSDLSEKQVGDLLDYLAIGGPDIRPADERAADTADPAQFELGRRLFQGEVALRSGAQACAACHEVQGARLHDGTLGPDLTLVYRRYRDRSLTTFLRRPSAPSFHAGATEPYLTAEESFAIKAYLCRTAAAAGPTAVSATR